MSKKNIIILISLALIIVVGLSINLLKNNKEETSSKEVEKTITNYLNYLSKKDIKGLKEISTDKWSENFDNDTIDVLNKTLESAKLINSEIKEKNEDRILVYAEVELICYKDASPVGDWVPGKSISKKSFELIKTNGIWKINNWGVY